MQFITSCHPTASPTQHPVCAPCMYSGTCRLMHPDLLQCGAGARHSRPQGRPHSYAQATL